MPRFSQHLPLNISVGKVCRIYTHIVEINNCQNKSTWTLRGCDAAEMWRTRKSSFEAANSHFSWLKARPLAARMASNARRCVPCRYLGLLKVSSSSRRKKHIFPTMTYISYGMHPCKENNLFLNLGCRKK
jgi:hypothetical protein